MTVLAHPTELDVAVVRRPARPRLMWLVVAFGVLLIVMVASVAIGSRAVSWSDIWGALGGSPGFDRRNRRESRDQR